MLTKTTPSENYQGAWQPFLIRVGGLPVDTMAVFHSELPARLKKLDENAGKVIELRNALVQQIHQHLSQLDTDLRRLALTVKRHAFNGRPLSGPARQPEWPTLVAKLPLTASLLQLEQEVAADHDAFAQDLKARKHREVVALIALFHDVELRRGLALASPALVAQLDRLLHQQEQNPADLTQGRKARKAMVSLLRYVSRAALKLSPYSTLTRVALGKVGSTSGARLLGESEAWSSRSLVRLQRYILSQVIHVLQHHKPFRNTLTLQWNPTAFELHGRWHWLRPAGWQLDTTIDRPRPVQQALVKAAFKGDVLRWLARQTQAPAEPTTLPVLLERARHELGTAEQTELEGLLERLLDLGLLVFQSPISVFEAKLEDGLIAHFEKMKAQGHDAADLMQIQADLQGILALQAALPHSSDPAQEIDRLEAAILELWRQASPLGPWPGAKLAKNLDDHFFEDLFVTGPGENGELFEVGQQEVRRLRQDLASLVHLSTLLDRRFELLLTLSAAFGRQWPDQARVPLLQAFEFLQPFTRDFRAFLKNCRPNSVFNPLELADVDKVAALRREVLADYRAAIQTRGNEDFLDPAELAILVERIPRPFRSAVGACFFLQPCGDHGRQWVMNWLHEGTGRFGSRFTVVMEPHIREKYVRHLQAASHARATRPDLLDLLVPGSENLNVHAPISATCLIGPGDHCPSFPGSVLGIEDLYFSVDPESGLPRLEDADGKSLLPAHLGGSDHRLLPVLLKFLADLGPGDLRGRLPSSPTLKSEDGIEIQTRLSLGSVVVRRARWVVPTAELARSIADLEDHEAFVAIDRWRRGCRLPERVFIIERIAAEQAQPRYKPQYIDFSSPLFVAVFRAALALNGERLDFEELLPAPEMAIRDEAGRPWAVELLLDEAGLAPAESATAGAEIAGFSTTLEPLPTTDGTTASGVWYAGA